MEHSVKLFEENSLLGGYSLAVRDDWVYKIKRVHVTEKEREQFLDAFGEKIITYNEFFDWWCQINSYGEYADDSYDDKF